MERAISALGLVVFVGIAYLFSNNRKGVRWRTVLWGLGLQAALAVIVIRTPWGFAAFSFLGNLAKKFLDFSDAGASFVFGEKFTDHFFAFKVLPTIIFVSAGDDDPLLLRRAAAGGAGDRLADDEDDAHLRRRVAVRRANIFVGQTEAPLLIRPYLATLTQSELHAVMVGGFAHDRRRRDGGVHLVRRPGGPPDRRLGDGRARARS